MREFRTKGFLQKLAVRTTCRKLQMNGRKASDCKHPLIVNFPLTSNERSKQMSKIQSTYRTRPYFYPSKGDLLTDDQVAHMCEPIPASEMGHPWVVVVDQGWRVLIDFADLDGRRSDWFDHRTSDNHIIGGRVWAVRTHTNNQRYWLVTHTSYGGDC